ncbi:MAG: hypothetical protein WD492_10385 [Alkalispirochaeta sp.]
MSYQEQRSVLTMASGVTIFIVFFLLALPRFHALDPAVLSDGTAVLRWGAGAMLVFIASSIVIRILLMILFSIFYRIISGEEPPEIEDERDRQIELKVNHVAQTLFILGFVGALVAVRIGASPVGMLLVMAISGVISEVVGESTRIVLYRRGF